MDNYIIFNGVSSQNFGLKVFGHGTYTDPSSDMDEIIIPGRNGALHQYNGRYSNVKAKYSLIDIKEFQSSISYGLTAFRAYVLSLKGYKRLEDTFDKEIYRMAVYKGSTPIKAAAHDEVAGMEIEFDCLPQRFLKSGEFPVQFTDNGEIYNHTYFTALPIIRVYGDGSFSVNNTEVQISSNSGYTDIDCELQDAHYGMKNRNANITLVNGEFPSLISGINEIIINGLTKIEITPRWYTI